MHTRDYTLTEEDFTAHLRDIEQLCPHGTKASHPNTKKAAELFQGLLATILDNPILLSWLPKLLAVNSSAPERVELPENLIIDAISCSKPLLLQLEQRFPEKIAQLIGANNNGQTSKNVFQRTLARCDIELLDTIKDRLEAQRQTPSFDPACLDQAYSDLLKAKNLEAMQKLRLLTNRPSIDWMWNPTQQTKINFAILQGDIATLKAVAVVTDNSILPEPKPKDGPPPSAQQTHVARKNLAVKYMNAAVEGNRPEVLQFLFEHGILDAHGTHANVALYEYVLHAIAKSKLASFRWFETTLGPTFMTEMDHARGLITLLSDVADLGNPQAVGLLIPYIESGAIRGPTDLDYRDPRRKSTIKEAYLLHARQKIDTATAKLPHRAK